MKRNALFLLSLLVLSFVLFMVPLGSAPYESEAQPFGNYSLPNWLNVTVTEDSNFVIVDNADGLLFKFRKGTAGYTEVYQNGSLLIGDERWRLEYESNPNNWKMRGEPQSVSWEQPTGYHAIVKRCYTDFAGTTFNITYSFYGGFNVKVSFDGYIAQDDTYRIVWKTSGINTTNILHTETNRSVKCWNANEEAIGFDYSDVYQNFGNITICDIEASANNHKLDQMFHIGTLGVGVFTLDPSFGYYTIGSSDASVAASMQENIRGSLFTLSEATYINHITMALKRSIAGSQEIGGAIYRHSDLSFVGATETTIISVTTGYVWYRCNFTTPLYLTADDYLIVCHGKYATAQLFIAKDTGVANQGHVRTVAYSEEWPDPLSSVVHDAYLHSIYALEAPENEDATITNMEGCGNWLIAEERYYYFQAEASYVLGADAITGVKIRFTDGENIVIAAYDAVDQTFTLESGEDVAALAGSEGTATTDEDTLTVVFPIYLRSRIIDTLNVDLYMQSLGTAGCSLDWELMQTDYFNIYNLGGFATLETSGTAGRITKGDVFELYAENASWAYANTTYHNLQHVHMLFHIWQENQRSWDDWETDTIEIRMGIDYCYDDTWISGWSVYLEQYEGWLDASTMRLRWTVKWYYQGVEIWSSTMNSFPLVNETGDTGIPAQTSFIVDFWFNKVNASSTVGGRVAAEYYAMRDNANPWLRWATGNNWGADVGNVTQAMFFEDLEDNSDNIISCKQIEMMSVWCNLSQGNNNNDIRHELRDFDLFSVFTAEEAMEGVNTPIFIATKTPDMPQGGFLNALWGAIQGVFGIIVAALTSFTFAIVDVLSIGVLGFWTVFVAFLDTIFTWVGWPNGFSSILNLVSQFLGWTTSAITQLPTVFIQIFIFITGTFTYMITYMVELFTNLVNFYSHLTWMWNYMYQYVGWVPDVLWACLPLLCLFYGIWVVSPMFGKSLQRGLEGMQKRVEVTVGFVVKISKFLWKIVDFTVGLVYRLIETVPIAE